MQCNHTSKVLSASILMTATFCVASLSGCGTQATTATGTGAGAGTASDLETTAVSGTPARTGTGGPPEFAHLIPEPRIWEDGGNEDVFPVLTGNYDEKIYVIRWENGIIEGYLEFSSDGRRIDLGEEARSLLENLSVNQPQFKENPCWVDGKLVIRCETPKTTKSSDDSEGPEEPQLAQVSIQFWVGVRYRETRKMRHYAGFSTTQLSGSGGAGHSKKKFEGRNILGNLKPGQSGEGELGTTIWRETWQFNRKSENKKWFEVKLVEAPQF